MQHIQIAAAQIIQRVLADGRNLNQVLDESLRGKSDWTPQHRATLQDLSYGTLRFLGPLQAVLRGLLHKPLADERVRFLLLVALYQLQYSKAAEHAIVNHAVLAAQILNPRVGGLVNAILRNFLRGRDELLVQATRDIEGKYSYPRWWIESLRAQQGDQAEAVLIAGNGHPPMTLRVNQRRISTDDYLTQLTQAGLAAQQIGASALLLDKPVAVDKLPGFFDGLVSVQDAGAQLAARLLDVRDEMRVLDACAAPGGKTAHILEIANVVMLALDKDDQRLQRVEQNLQRLKLDAQLRVGDASMPVMWWDGKPFDRILADVPCSASGVVRRHPDIKWLRRSADIASFATQQREILRALWPLLARDGKLLYATCSVFQQENEHVIADFLQQQSDARRLPLSEGGAGQLLPNEQHDGFFYALLHKIP